MQEGCIASCVRCDLLSKWDHSTVQTIMRFLVFLYIVHKTVIFCWLPSHMGISGNERTDSTAKAAQQKYVSDCLISYTDAYQYISQYVHDLWHHHHHHHRVIKLVLSIFPRISLLYR